LVPGYTFEITLELRLDGTKVLARRWKIDRGKPSLRVATTENVLPIVWTTQRALWIDVAKPFDLE